MCKYNICMYEECEHICKPCRAGKYQNSVGNANESSCLFYGPGYAQYQTGTGMTGPNQKCTLCAAGTYQTGTGMTDHSVCLLCQPGTYQSWYGFPNCTFCPAGIYLTSKGMPSNCSLCPSGIFQSFLGAIMIYILNCSLCAEAPSKLEKERQT